MNKVSYEWTVEQLESPGGDILTVEFHDTPEEMLIAANRHKANWNPDAVEWGAVRRILDEDSSTIDRGYSYVQVGGMLEPEFDNGETVPQHIHTALVRAQKVVHCP